MSGMRGNIPRRRPDPNRAIKPRNDGQAKRASQGDAPMFHDVGKITVPPDGSVSIFSYRFPCSGRVREASIRLLGVPLGSDISVVVAANSKEIFNSPWVDGYPMLKIPDTLPVDEYTFLSVTLSRKGGDADIVINADIAYIFQEHARATVQHPV